jgi:acetolactate synthase regulatory subunit
LDVVIDRDECVFPMVRAGDANKDMLLSLPNADEREKVRAEPMVVRGGTPRRHHIFMLAGNRVGALARVSALLSGKGYDFENLTAESDVDNVVRITMTVHTGERDLEQMVRQLRGLVDAIEVRALHDASDTRAGESRVQRGRRH